MSARATPAMFLDIRDKPGCISKEAMRKLFEQSVRESESLCDRTPLGMVVWNAEFSHYVDPDTDTMWLGFALGMRCAERISKAQDAAAGSTK